MASVPSPNSVAGNSSNGGAKIGRPPQWNESRSRKLARLYMYTTLPIEMIIKALFPNDEVKKNSAQKTMHKMVGQDPRSLRPNGREEMNSRFKLLHKRSQRKRQSDVLPYEQEEGVIVAKEELNTPAFSDAARFDDSGFLTSPQDELHIGRSDALSPNILASPSTTGPVFSPVDKDEDAGLPFGHQPFPRLPRNDTVFTTSTQMSTDSIKGLKTRLRVSTIFAKQVNVLMKRLTMDDSNTAGTPSPCQTPIDLSSSRGASSSGPIPYPGLAVPGDFVIAPKYVGLCVRERHFARSSGQEKVTCWCSIADDITDLSGTFFVTTNGELCDRAANILSGGFDASGVDQFGNSPLHLLAALDGPQDEFILQLIDSNNSNPRAINKAGQTFLHVLSASWFSGLVDQTAPLYRLLNRLSTIDRNMVFVRDVYGRTFFHQLDRFVDDIQIFDFIAQQYTLFPQPRDAFGVRPPAHAVDHSFPAPRRMGTVPLSPLAEETSEEAFTTRETKLASIASAAYDVPAVEDEDGRNGLHCLAEMNFATDSTSSNPTSPNPNKSSANPKGSLKRKHGRQDADRDRPIDRRFAFLQGLLTPLPQTAPPDVNHYDKRGNTVLMAFATHLLDEQDDRHGDVIGKILDLLIDQGANIGARNRRGETALLVAARQGNKNVVNKLLDRGANPHARDKDGRGIMGIIDAQIAQSSSHLPTYGRLEAVRAVVMAKKLGEQGMQDEPSFLDEWCWPQNGQA